MPDRVKAFQELDPKDFERQSQGLLEKRLVHEEFKAVLPLKVSHGKAYRSYNSLQREASKGKATPRGSKSASLPGTADTTACNIPLLHMFRFNRLVVDEYHYMYTSKEGSNHTIATAIKSIPAVKRWILSGTPPLANFSDVSQTASFLGVKLGRNVCGDGTVTTEFEKRRAQDFPNKFVRQNELALQEIQIEETLRPVQLDFAHSISYLDLSNFLATKQMLQGKTSQSPEEKLLVSALFSGIKKSSDFLDQLIADRKRERQDIEVDIASLARTLKISSTKDLNKNSKDLYLEFKHGMNQNQNYLGDDMAQACMQNILNESVHSLAFTKQVKKQAKSLENNSAKALVSRIWPRTADLVESIRSERFVSKIKRLLSSHQGDDQVLPIQCDLANCRGPTDLSQLYLSINCGHITCYDCAKTMNNSEVCAHPGCDAQLQATSLIQVTELKRHQCDESGSGFGRKLDSIIELIESVPEDDQGVVFVPGGEVMSIFQDIFSQDNIPYHALDSSNRAAARKLEDFQTNRDPIEMKKVLILNLMSESAAGA